MDDDDGFRDFVRARLPRLSRVAYLLTGDHHSAQDLVQVTLIKLAGHWSRMGTVRDPDAYVRRMMYHAHASAWRLRFRQVERPTGVVPDAANPRDEAEDVVRHVVLRRALERLTRRQRAVLVLRYFEDASEAETARALNCSIGTVKSQTHHALARLRELAPELSESLLKEVAP